MLDFKFTLWTAKMSIDNDFFADLMRPGYKVFTFLKMTPLVYKAAQNIDAPIEANVENCILTIKKAHKVIKQILESGNLEEIEKETLDCIDYNRQLVLAVTGGVGELKTTLPLLTQILQPAEFEFMVDKIAASERAKNGVAILLDSVASSLSKQFNNTALLENYFSVHDSAAKLPDAFRSKLVKTTFQEEIVALFNRHKTLLTSGGFTKFLTLSPVQSMVMTLLRAFKSSELKKGMLAHKDIRVDVLAALEQFSSSAFFKKLQQIPGFEKYLAEILNEFKPNDKLKASKAVLLRYNQQVNETEEPSTTIEKMKLTC